MKSDIRKKHLCKNLLIKQIFSSYIVTFLIIASFSLLFLGTYGNIVDAKKLFTSSDSSDDSTDPVLVSSASSKANENSVIAVDSTNPAIEKTETVNPSTIVNENSVIAVDSTNPAIEKTEITTESSIADENLNESDKNESDFWTWLSNYDKDDEDVNNCNSDYLYNETSDNIGSLDENESIKLKELGIISKLKHKLFNSNYYFTASYLLIKFDKYIK